MELIKLDIYSLNNVYAISRVKREFSNAVNEAWKDEPPWKRYQEKLMQDLAVLEQEKERAISLPQYEKLTGIKNLYSIRHPETGKNVRIIYYITNIGEIILLTAFLEKNDNDYKLALNRAKNRLKWLLK